MDTWTIFKLTSCISMWTTLFFEYSNGAERHTNIPKDFHNPSTSPTRTPPKPSKEESSSSIPSASAPQGHQNVTNLEVRNGQNGSGALDDVGLHNSSADFNSTFKSQSLPYKSIEIKTQETGFSSSTWIYITMGILCVAAFNVYMFWYRKRTTTYPITPTATPVTTKTTSRARR